MRLLLHLCNQRLITYHTEHMWPMSEKVKKLISKNKLLIKDNLIIEDYGWPKMNDSLPKQRIKSKKESV